MTPRTSEDIVLGLQHTPSLDPIPGEWTDRGAYLGIEYINTRMGGVLGGRKVRLEEEHHLSRPEIAAAGYRRLVTEKKAVAVFGFEESPTALAVNEVANDLGVPVIATFASHSAVTAKGFPTAFRMNVVDPARATLWLHFMKHKGYKRIGAIVEDTSYGLGLLQETTRQAPEVGARIALTGHVVDPLASDFTGALLKTMELRPDLVLNMTSEPQDIIIEQAIDVGLFPSVPMLLASDHPANAKWWVRHPRSTGMMFISFFDRSRLSGPGKWMRERYREEYGIEPGYSDFSPFGAALVIAQAIDLAKSAEPKQIIRALETGSFTGWSSQPVTFPKKPGVLWHNWSPPMRVFQLTEQGQDYTKAPAIFDGSSHPETAGA